MDQPIEKQHTPPSLFLSRGLMVCVLGVFVFWIINANIPIDGKKIYARTIDQASPFIGYFHPSARVEDPQTVDGKSVQRVLEEPLYFEARTFVEYTTVHVSMTVKNETSQKPQIGIELQNGGQKLIDTHVSENGDGWQTLEADVPLYNAAWLNGWYHFVLSCPGLMRGTDESGKLSISEVTTTFSRAPISFNDIQEVWTRFIQ